MEPRRPQRKKATREKPQKEPAAAAVSDEEDVEVGGAPGGVAGEEKKLRGSSSSSSTTTIVPAAAAAAPKRVPAAPPCCQAEECAADLTEAKRYHRRHKVCEVHSKAAVVIVAGLRQRFCQQCSRFHELSEFDDAKRSCRRRLAGHNERRRKSSSDPQGDGLNRCRPADHEGRIQMSSDSGNPTYKHFQIR